MFEKGKFFASCYLKMSWNLMARTNNTAGISCKHLGWSQDSLTVVFGKTKTDQSGESNKEARSIFANPFNPSICPILALGLYLMSVADLRTSTAGDSSLFPGGNQATRFSKHMKSVLSTDEGKALLQALGISLEDLGTHSMRKGSGAFSCSGSTSGPGIVAVCIRMGWSMGGVADRYLQFEAAADKYLGRVCSGLPQTSRDFCVLMPHCGSFDVSEQVEKCFPALYGMASLVPVLNHCLASIVFHKYYLIQNLPTNSIIFQNVLFRESGMIGGLFEKVTTQPTIDLLASGIPPHIQILEKLESLSDFIKNCPAEIVQEISNVMEENGIAAGNISRSFFEQTLKRVMSKIQSAQTSNVTEEQAPSSRSEYRAYMWSGSFHKVPINFQFPECSLLTAMQLWFQGNPQENLPPFRLLTSRDMSGRKLSRILSEWRCVMKSIETSVGSLWKEDPNSSEIVEMYEKAMDMLPINEDTTKHRKRKSGQLHLTTALKLIRKKRRLETTEAE